MKKKVVKRKTAVKKTVRTNLTERIAPYLSKSNKSWVMKEAKTNKVSVSVVVNDLLTKSRKTA